MKSQLKACFGLGLMWLGMPVHAAEKVPAAKGMEVRFTLPRDGTVMVNIYGGDGQLVRRLEPGQPYKKGPHKLVWDGKLDGDRGEAAGAGEYTWKALYHEGLGLKLRGWVGCGGGVPWATEDGKGGWGGDSGVPIAVAADDKQVYLGWSMTMVNASVVACDLNGRVQWKSRRAGNPYSGCKALAVDDGIVYVLGGDGHGLGDDIQYAEGECVYRLNAQDGKLMPWPNGETDLKIASLWPADAKTKPNAADAMAVRHGHMYLSFTNSQFMAVLDTQTQAYLQTVVGAPPGLIDVAPTQTELPDAPGKLADADFALLSLGGGVLGRILFAHDPIWVITSDLVPTEDDQTITALTILGDKAKFHHHMAFVGYGAPIHQVQARPLLDTDQVAWVAGPQGGRPMLGPWVADSLRSIRGVALAADGKLWVAEGEAFPKRFSVWDTTGKQGKLVREFFGSPTWSATGGAISPLDPDIMAAQNCEWRIDPKTGAATCLGVIARDQAFAGAHYAVGQNGHAYLLTCSSIYGDPPVRIFERLGAAEYKLRARIYRTGKDGEEAGVGSNDLVQTVFWSDKNGDGREQADERTVVPDDLHFDLPQFLHGLDLQYRIESGENWMLPVVGWTSCGAPQYDPQKPRKLPPYTHRISADGKLCLATWTSAGQLGLACFEVESGRKRWEFPSGDADDTGYDSKSGFYRSEWLAGGGAYLPGLLKNVWAVGQPGGRWRVVTEDGFILAYLSARYNLDAHMPAEARPGADLSAADSRAGGVGSVTQAANGKVYVQSGWDAYWNEELTGLDKVKAIPGGKLTVPVK